MSIGNNRGTEEHRERGRGRKAFWIIMGAALLIGVVFAAWSPRHGHFGAYRAPSAVDTVLDSTVEIWSALTPDQRAEVLRLWKRRS
jgi:hypothetical protein